MVQRHDLHLLQEAHASPQWNLKVVIVMLEFQSVASPNMRKMLGSDHWDKWCMKPLSLCYNEWPKLLYESKKCETDCWWSFNAYIIWS